MELLALLETLRTDYLRRFEAAYSHQIELNEQVIPEIAFEISQGVYKRLYVVDLIGKNGEASSVIEVATTEDLHIGEVSLQYRGLALEFGNVAWDGVRFSIQPVPDELVGFEEWFDKWIDLDGTRHADVPLFSSIIHSSMVADGLVEVDFGSAPEASFIELLDLFVENRVNKVEISSSRE